MYSPPGSILLEAPLAAVRATNLGDVSISFSNLDLDVPPPLFFGGGVAEALSD